MINQISKLGGLTPQPKPQEVDAAGQVAATATQARGSPEEAKDVGPKAVEAAEVQRAKVESLAEGFNALVQDMNRELNFQVDEITGNLVIRVIDAKTEEVVRQIPAEELLALQHRLSEIQETGKPADASVMDGVLFDKKA